MFVMDNVFPYFFQFNILCGTERILGEIVYEQTYT